MEYDKRFYTIREFLDDHPMGRSTFYRLVSAGDIVITKVGRSSRIDRVDIEKWVASLPKFHGTASNDNV